MDLVYGTYDKRIEKFFYENKAGVNHIIVAVVYTWLEEACSKSENGRWFDYPERIVEDTHIAGNTVRRCLQALDKYGFINNFNPRRPIVEITGKVEQL